MTPDQIALVQTSFAKVAPISDQAAAIFYEKLFALNPDLRGLFKSDLSEQGRKLMATLGVVVKGLDAPENILPVAGELAKRHVSYGVRPEHYALVGEALLITLNIGLGDDFTHETRDAWAAAYGIVSDHMIGAAYGDSKAIAS